MQITKLKIFHFALLGLFLFIQLFVFFPAPTVSAAGDLWSNQVGMDSSGVGKAFNGGSAPKDIRVMIGQIIKVFLAFLGIIFLALMIWAGYRWMMAGGNEQTVTEAKSQIINAVVGFIIIMLAYSITFYVTSCIFDVTTANSTWMCNPY